MPLVAVAAAVGLAPLLISDLSALVHTILGMALFAAAALALRLVPTEVFDELRRLRGRSATPGGRQA